MTNAQKTAALDAARRASTRSAAVVHGDMKRGLSNLASIAASAPILGFFGTLLGIVNSFSIATGERWAVFAFVMNRLSESLVPTALGLLVATLAYCGYKCLVARLEDFDVEMRNASLELMNELRSTRA